MNHDKLSVAVQGRIVSSNLIHPKRKYFDELEYRLVLEPTNPWETQVIDQRIEEIRRTQPSVPKPLYEEDYHPDEVRKGYSLMFKSLHEPRLLNIMVPDDNDIRNEYVSVLGNIQFMKDGNAYLSVHEVTRIDHPGDFLDLDYDGPVDNDF